MTTSKLTRRALLIGSGALLVAAGIERVVHFRSTKVGPRNPAGNAPHVANPNWLAAASDEELHALLLVGSDGAILFSDDGGTTFERASTPVHHALFTVLVHRKSRRVIAAGAEGCVVVSDDRGRTFRKVPSGTVSGIRRLAASRSGDIIAVGDKGLVLASKDAGERWTVEESNCHAHLAHLVALAQGEEWLAAGEQGALLRRDVAGKWREVKLGTDRVITSALVRSDGVVVLGTDAGAILRSMDGWNYEIAHIDCPPELYATSFAETDDGKTLLAATNRGHVLRSTDTGRTWFCQNLATNEYLSVAVFDRRESRFLIAGSGGSLFQSTNLGATFERLALGSTEDLDLLLFAPRSGRSIAAGRGGTVATKPSAGSAVEISTHGVSKYLHAVVCDSTSGSAIAVGSSATCVRSTDGGFTWSPVGLGLADSVTLFAVGEHVATRTLFIGGSGGALLRSLDGGRQWTRISATDQSISGFHFTGRRVLAFALDEGVLFSDDAGQRFARAAMPRGSSLLSACNIDSTGRIVAVGMEGNICRSLDGGGSWETRPSGTSSELRAVTVEPHSGAIWIAGNAGTLLRSTDGGEHFETVPVPTNENLMAFGYHAASKSLFVAGTRGTLLHNLQDGEGFEVVPTATQERLRICAADPVSGDLFVSGTGGFLLHIDSNLNRNVCFTHTSAKLASVAYHPNSAAWIFVGERILRLSAEPFRTRKT